MRQTKNFPWSAPTTEERWHAHAEGVLMVALTTLNLPTEAWRSARLLRAVPNCRLVLMMAYHMLSPALSVEENGLMTYLQTPPEAGPSIAQATSGLQNWKCDGRRLVEIGGRLPTATQLHQSFIKILSKHLAVEQEIEFHVSSNSRATIPMMSPSPTEIVELVVFVEVTLIQYATVAGHFPGVNASSVKPKPKKANKVEITSDEPKGEIEVSATTPTTPRPKPKAQPKASPQATPTKVEKQNRLKSRKKAREVERGSAGNLNPVWKRESSNASISLEETCQRGDQCRCEHQVGDDGKPVSCGDQRSSRDLMML